MTTLTDRQAEVLRWLIEFQIRRGYAPSIREIGEAFAIGSLRGVTAHLDALHLKGFILRDLDGSARALQILKNPEGQPIRLTFEVVS